MARSRLKNDSRLRRKLRRFPETVREEIKVEMTNSANDLLAEIKALAPRDEGRLAENATARVSRDGLSAKIGYSGTQSGFKRAFKRAGFYAAFQEFGTSRHSAHPFLRPAFRNKLRSILDRIDKAVNSALKKASQGDY